MFFDGISIVEGSNVDNLTVASGTSFPAEPSLGELFYKTPGGLYLYDGSTWNAVASGDVGSTYTAGTGIDLTNDVISLASGVATAGTYPKVTVDTYGRVTTGTTLSASEIGFGANGTALTFDPNNNLYWALINYGNNSTWNHNSYVYVKSL